MWGEGSPSLHYAKIYSIMYDNKILYIDNEQVTRMIEAYYCDFVKKYGIQKVPKEMLYDLYVAFLEGWIARGKVQSDLDSGLMAVDEVSNKQI